MKIPLKIKNNFSEQDTADKLVLQYLHIENTFPAPESMDYQAQHSVPIDESHRGSGDVSIISLEESSIKGFCQKYKFSKKGHLQDISWIRIWNISIC